ncbi:hypothetical protein F4Z99_00175 [Candidatus Poribacteria bacterium]|nr:hypothetical protein [Candidatus Poribacteria bacterium]MYC39894.1 hypothetical protein [Candidatus Dadabacteria bacterium]
MLNASPNFPLASPALQHAVTDDRQQLWVDPQFDPLKNFNSARYFESNCPSAPLQIVTITGSYNFDYDKSDFVQTSGNRYGRKPAERQFSLRILSSRTLPSRFAEATMPLVGFGPAAPVATTAAWLEASLDELEECSASALDEGLEEPSELGLTKAKKLLETVSNRVTDQPDIYLMDEGSIAIDFRNPGSKSGVLFLIEQDGSGALFHRTKNSKGRLRVHDAADLLQEGGFLELERVGIR